MKKSISEKIQSIRGRAASARADFRSMLAGNRGEVAVSTIGGIIIAVVFVGLLIVAINKFFPDFFTGMFDQMKTKLDANW